MALYLISYDIDEGHTSEHDRLREKLEELGAVQILHAAWAVAGDAGKAETIYEETAVKLQAKDKLLVQELAHDAMWDRLLIPDEDFVKLLSYARR